MNILIIGEYSGFSKNLKLGFERLGNHVVLFQEGDGWKKIDTGNNSYAYPFYKNFKILNFSLRKTYLLRGLSYLPKFRKDIKKYNNYFDVVLIINYEFIRLSHEFWLPRFSINDIKNTLRDNGKIFLSACGDDYTYVNYTPNFRYTNRTKNPKGSFFFSKRGLKIFNIVKSNIKGVIPVIYDYAVAYRNIQRSDNIRIFPTIPLPIDTKDVIPSNVIKGKIVIFHGLNSIMKGPELIIEALRAIEKKYPTQVEVIIDGKMPLTDYLKLLRRTNIVVDQCYAYSYGMNALYSMAMGKVVLSGNEPECEIEFGVKSIPVINILPNVKDIETKIEKLINDPQLLLDISKRSISFVNEIHDNVKVAQQYIDIFNVE